MRLLLKYLSKFKYKKYFLRLIHYVWIPLGLTLLFVWQNLLFNNWLEIYPGQYFFRRGLVTFALGLILFGPALFFKKIGRHFYLFIVSTFLSAIFLAEFIYYKYAGGFLQASSIRYIGEAATQTGTVISLISLGLILFCLNFLFWGIDIYLFHRFDKNYSNINLIEKFLIIIIIAGITIVAYGHLIRVEKNEWGNLTHLYQNIFDYDNYVSKVGIIHFFLQDTSKLILQKKQVSPEDKIFYKNWLENKMAATSTPKYFGLAKNKNLILIQIESLENCVINQVINNQEITPNLNRLTKDGLYFSNYYSQFGPGTTADAEFSTLNSLYPLADIVAFEQYAKNRYYALPHLLKQNNYQTYSFHGDVSSFWNRANIYPNLGYDQWFNQDNYISKNPLGGAFELSDKDFFEQTAEKIKTLPQPFMATLMTLSLHTPFVIPANLQALKLEDANFLSQTQKDYLQTAHYTDEVLGEFIESLKKENLYNNSLIAIYGDHGSYTDIALSLNEKNNLTIGLNNSRVPLILLSSQLELTGENIMPASHLDLYPTIINLLGIKNSNLMLGQDILNTLTPVMTRRNNISGTIKTILTDKLAFQSSPDGIFEHGTCGDVATQKFIEVENCKKLYQNQAENLKISDLIIWGNLLDNK